MHLVNKHSCIVCSSLQKCLRHRWWKPLKKSLERTYCVGWWRMTKAEPAVGWSLAGAGQAKVGSKRRGGNLLDASRAMCHLFFMRDQAAATITTTPAPHILTHLPFASVLPPELIAASSGRPLHHIWASSLLLLPLVACNLFPRPLPCQTPFPPCRRRHWRCLSMLLPPRAAHGIRSPRGSPTTRLSSIPLLVLP